MDKYIGKRLDGRYEINELIGIGGMAEVYKATDLLEKRPVAVKILKKEFADKDDFVRRFRNESKAIAVLSHPNIVKIYDVGITDKIQYIVMEYIDGITLKEFMEQQGALKWKDSVYFIVQILRALQHAHDRGIVHRDIKPQNIMLFQDGSIKVMDFGIARFAREEGRTISDKAIGSVHYISPEQARGETTDEKSDIYSAGVMLYEMLTGQKPFDGEGPIQIALMHMQETPRSIRSINPEIPEGLETIVFRAMQRDPEKRYQSASEMIKDIDIFRKNPEISFDYDITVSSEEEQPEPEDELDMENDDEGGTRYFEAVTKNEPAHKQPQHRREQRVKEHHHEHYEDDYDDDYDDYDDDYGKEEVSKTSYFVVILTAVAAAVIIMAVAFIAINIIPSFVNKPNDISTAAMVDLVGHDYLECKNSYTDYFNLVIDDQVYSDEYPAGTIISQSPKKDATIIVGSTEVKVVVSKGTRIANIPNIYTFDMTQGSQMLKNEGFVPAIIMENSDVAANKVIRTDPERYTDAPYGSTVKVYVSLGPEQYDVIMPDVVGMDLIEAVQLLEGMGFNVKSEKQDSEVTANEVLSQSISALDEHGDPRVLDPHQDILIIYSSGEAPTIGLNITFDVPEGLDGPASFKAYVNGVLSGTSDVDNMGYVTTISIRIKGNDQQKVVVEAVARDGVSHQLGIFNVDFITRSVETVEFDHDLLVNLYPGPELTETVTMVPDDELLDDDDVETTKKKKKKKTETTTEAAPFETVPEEIFPEFNPENGDDLIEWNGN